MLAKINTQEKLTQEEIILQDALSGFLIKFTKAEFNILLKKRNDIPTYHFIYTIVLIFIAPLFFSVQPSIFLGIICALINVHSFNRFAQIVHGSDHSALFSNLRYNSIVGKVAGYFLGYTRAGHKQTHNSHHNNLNGLLDADRVWCKPEAPADTIFKGWVSDFLGISAFKRFTQYAGGSITKNSLLISKTIGLVGLWPALVLHLLIFSLYAISSGPQYYFLIYLLPLATIYPAQIRLRSNVEHGFEYGFSPKNELQNKVTRSTNANWLERFIMAPLYIEYHYEHHLLPTMPYYNSPLMRELLSSKGFEVPIAQGYFNYFFSRWRFEKKHA